MRWALGLLAALLCAAPAQAVELVNPDGSPVGGKWQRWANAARVPTVRGSLPFSTDASDLCGGARGCSWGWPGSGTSALSVASDRDSLYFELGHIFDWRYLTRRDRRWLATFWGVPRAHWFDTERSVNAHSEDGLEADFAAAYASCAQGHGFDVIGLFASPGVPVAPAIHPRTERGTCTFIRRVSPGH